MSARPLISCCSSCKNSGVGAFVSASAYCVAVVTCFKRMSRKAKADRTKLCPSKKCLAFLLGGLLAVPIAARESDSTVMEGPLSVASGQTSASSLTSCLVSSGIGPVHSSELAEMTSFVKFCNARMPRASLVAPFSV